MNPPSLHPNGGRTDLLKLAVSFLVGMLLTATVAWFTHVKDAVTRVEVDRITAGMLSNQSLVNKDIADKLSSLQIDMAKISVHLGIDEGSRSRGNNAKHP